MDSADNSDARIIASDGQLYIHADISDNTADSLITFRVDDTEYMRIHADGEVDCKGGGAGQNALLVTGNYSSGNNADIQTWQRIGGAVQAKMIYKDATTDLHFGSDTAHNFSIMTGGTDRLRIQSDGDLSWGISPNNTLWDSSSNESGVYYRQAQGSLAMATRSNTGYSNWYMNKNTSGGTSDNRWIDFYWNATTIDKIWYNSGNVSFGGYSDYRLKENITEMDDGITKVKQLKPSYYTWKKGHGRDDYSDIKQSGFIAHEIQSVLPNLVDGTKDQVVTQAQVDAGTQPEESAVGTPIYQSVDYQKITPILTAAIKELIAEVETLKTEVAALKSS